MKAIILAAGKGTRIARAIENIPKSTLLINGVPLIRRNIEKLIDRGIEPIVCVGYEKEKVYEALKGLEVKYYYNPFYEITNSIASLWFAKNELEVEDEVIIMNADVYFNDEILDSIIDNTCEAVLMTDKTRIEVGDYFLRVENGYIKGYGKNIPVDKRSCEYVGIGKVARGFLPKFIERMEFLISNKEYKLWWENILYSFTDNENISILDVENQFWCEIDYYEDYERIIEYSSRKEKIRNVI